MRLPRITTRRLMALVAMAGILLGCYVIVARRRATALARAAKCLGLERDYAVAAANYSRAATRLRGERARRYKVGADAIRRKIAILTAARMTYERAARYPWLPVPPYPPAPTP